MIVNDCHHFEIFQKKGNKKSGKNKSKSHASKVANKNLNKFAKQGKLRKQRLKQKRKDFYQSKPSKPYANEKIENQDLIENDEEENELEEEDINFFGGQDTAFVRYAKKAIDG